MAKVKVLTLKNNLEMLLDKEVADILIARGIGVLVDKPTINVSVPDEFPKKEK